MAREKDRRVESSRAEAIKHHKGELFRKIPKITRLEDCVMEIDTVRGVIGRYCFFRFAFLQRHAK